MKFSAEAADIAAAVGYVAPVVMVSAPMPALAGILIEVGPHGAAGSGLASFMATDAITYQGAGVNFSGDFAGDEPNSTSGKVVVSGRMLAEVTKALPAGPLDVRLDGSHLELVQKRSRYRIPVIGEPFPAPPVHRAAEFHQVPTGVLSELLAAVRHCCDDRSLQAPGVMLDLGSMYLKATAMTNGALTEVTALQTGAGPPEAVRAIVGLGALEAAIKGTDEVKLCSADGSLMVAGQASDGTTRGAWIKEFTSSKTTLAARWFDGEPVGSVTVDSAELLAALKRIPLALEAGERDLPGANLSVAGDMLTISGRNGSAVEQVSCRLGLPSPDLLEGALTTTLLTGVLATCGKRVVTVEFHHNRLLVRDRDGTRSAAHVVMLRRML